MAIERYGSKTDVVVKLILVFFISLLSFSIGTLVGKKYSDNQHRLAKLEPGQHEATETASHDEHGAKTDRSVASVNPKAHEIKPEDALTDEEIAKLAEEFVDDDSVDSSLGNKIDKNTGHHADKSAHKEEHAQKPVAKAAQPAQSSSDHAEPVAHKEQKPSHAAQKLVEHQAPTATKSHADAQPRIPTSLPKELASSSVGKYTVQVASYGTEQEAQTKAAELKTKGYSAFYVPAKVKGQTWFRVSVGLFTTQREARTYMRDLTAKGQINSALIQKISAE